MNLANGPMITEFNPKAPLCILTLLFAIFYFEWMFKSTFIFAFSHSFYFAQVAQLPLEMTIC